MNSRLSVFVCGTYSDLSAERGAVLDALQRLEVEHHSVGFSEPGHSGLFKHASTRFAEAEL